AVACEAQRLLERRGLLVRFLGDVEDLAEVVHRMAPRGSRAAAGRVMINYPVFFQAMRRSTTAARLPSGHLGTICGRQRLSIQAVASISTRARSSTRAATCTMVMAG